MDQTIYPAKSISGTITVPGDKSISHRAVMLGSIANGNTEIKGFLNAEDCLSTINVFQNLGVEFERIEETSYIVRGKGLYGLKEPGDILDVGNSGTAIRLISGILAGQSFYSVLSGDKSILNRPMRRIVEPLSLMGARIDGRENGEYAPLTIKGNKLNGINYKSPISSAQVKSAVLFAGLYARNETTYYEPYKSRDHTEKMLIQFGAEIKSKDNELTIMPSDKLEGQQIIIPGDFSSAAYFIAAALIVPSSNLIIKNIGINPTRIGFLEAVKKMNGNIEILNERKNGREQVADIQIKSSSLKGINISGEWIPKIIDELPMLAVLATQSEGITEVSGASELRVKETDRIKAIVNELRRVGIKVEELVDGFVIVGKQKINGGVVKTYGDHRIGMAMAIAGLVAKKPITITEADVINISYPNFFKDLNIILKS